MIKTIQITLQGIAGSPLLMNPMTRQQLEAMRLRQREPKNTEKTIEQEAGEKIYRDHDSKMGIPRVNLFACLCEAGRQISFKGKTNLSTATSTFLPMIIRFEEGVRFFPFKDQETPWVADVVKGTNPNGGEAVAIVRPAFEDWSIEFKLEVDESTGVTDRTIFKLFKLAGAGIGLCDHRPNRKGEAGTFKVTAWKTIDERAATDAEKEFFDKGPRHKVTREDQINAELAAEEAPAQEEVLVGG
jgi:hypothetical protein